MWIILLCNFNCLVCNRATNQINFTGINKHCQIVLAFQCKLNNVTLFPNVLIRTVSVPICDRHNLFLNVRLLRTRIKQDSHIARTISIRIPDTRCSRLQQNTIVLNILSEIQISTHSFFLITASRLSGRGRITWIFLDVAQ